MWENQAHQMTSQATSTQNTQNIMDEEPSAMYENMRNEGKTINTTISHEYGSTNDMVADT